MADAKVYKYTAQRIVPCRGCGMEIFFYRSGEKADGSPRYIPVSLETGTSHFLDCPSANQFSGSKKCGGVMNKKQSEVAARRIFREVIATLESVPWDEKEGEYTRLISEIILEEAEK